MAYESNPFGPVRDKAYPSETAAQRPALATRIHCTEEPETLDPDLVEVRERNRLERESRDPSIRGSSADSPCERFNRELRSGLGTGRPDRE